MNQLKLSQGYHYGGDLPVILCTEYLYREIESMNQCDGCNSQLKLSQGYHYSGDLSVILCTEYLYREIKSMNPTLFERIIKKSKSTFAIMKRLFK